MHFLKKSVLFFGTIKGNIAVTGNGKEGDEEDGNRHESNCDKGTAYTVEKISTYVSRIILSRGENISICI
jgi:hypothetical protein